MIGFVHNKKTVIVAWLCAASAFAQGTLTDAGTITQQFNVNAVEEISEKFLTDDKADMQ